MQPSPSKTNNPYELLEYHGIRVGDRVQFTRPEEMTKHIQHYWDPYLDDTFLISSIRLAQVAHTGPKAGCGYNVPRPCLDPAPKIDPATGVYDTSHVPKEYILVTATSVEHRECKDVTLGIDCFLE